MRAADDDNSEKWEPFPRGPIEEGNKVHGLYRNYNTKDDALNLIGQTLDEKFLRFLDVKHIWRNLLVVVSLVYVNRLKRNKGQNLPNHKHLCLSIRHLIKELAGEKYN